MFFPRAGRARGVDRINRRGFMSELRSLLAFMDEDDRDRAIRRYEAMFDAAGAQGEEALLNALGSPVRQVLAVEKEVREAKKRGEVPFSGGSVPQPVTKQDGSSDLARMLRAAAEALESESAQAPAPVAGDAADAGDEDDFPIGDYYFAAPPASEEPFPAQELQLPPEAEAIFPADAVPAETAADASEEPPGDAGDTAGYYPEEDRPEEYYPEENYPEEVYPEEDHPEEGPDLHALPAEEPAAEEPAPPAEQAEEPPAPKKSRPARPTARRPVRRRSPGPGRVFAAVLVTAPFIVLWIVSFALFIILGTAVAALGFGLCAAGLYIGGYLFNGVVTFVPDMLLTGGCALLVLAAALLLLWTGLWIAVGGCTAVVRFSRGTYRRILGMRNEEEAEDDG